MEKRLPFKIEFSNEVVGFSDEIYQNQNMIYKLLQFSDRVFPLNNQLKLGQVKQSLLHKE